jgi:predicted HNH restriction endonuclease
MLPRYVPLSEAQRHFPEWGFLRQPHRSTDVPSALAIDFLSFLQADGPATIRFAEESDIEGTKTEIVRITGKRSRRLRNLAFQTARGVCSVCERDFSKVLNGRGVRVLQVHHRQQLAARDVPVVTKESDLAVVCANCHLLLHFNPEKALSVEELQEMLRVDSAMRMPNRAVPPDRCPVAVLSECEKSHLGGGR